MTSVQFAVVPEHVSDAGRYVQETAQTLVSGIRSADAEVSALMSSWKGAAATRYWEGWQETRQGAVEVLEALADMAQLLGVVAAKLPEVDQSRAGEFGSLSLP
ncbi:WXG100 family type VII secretion target [Nocardia sp. NPDC050712]|uniref:WXG100 family type VII secretion target n=1 Tax=Nocardia sp. NPDC050712 TaxID=3155518 RepID=UPI0033D55C68